MRTESSLASNHLATRHNAIFPVTADMSITPPFATMPHRCMRTHDAAHHMRESRTNVSTHMGTAAVCTATTQQPSTPLDVRCWVHKQPAEESVPDAHTQKECLAVLLCAVTCATHQHKANPAAGCSMPLTPLLLLLASECLPGLRLSHAPPHHLRRRPHIRPSNVGVNTLYSDSEAVTINKSINSQTECNRYKACLRACVHKTDTHIPHHTHS